MGLQGQVRVLMSGFGPIGLGSPRAHRAADDTADGTYHPSKRRAAGAQGLQHGALQAAAASMQRTAERLAHLCSGLGVGAVVGAGAKVGVGVRVGVEGAAAVGFGRGADPAEATLDGGVGLDDSARRKVEALG